MKKIIVSLSVVLSFYAITAQAEVFEAKPVADLVSLIQNTDFSYKETGKIFGFETTQSCLYVSTDFVILKNYCFPKKPYPATSFTIISAKFGMIDVYQEDLTSSVQKHDVQISAFPEAVQKYLKGPMTDLTIDGVNAIIKGLYYQKPYTGACWSTNYDYNDGVPVAKCNVEDVVDFEAWAQETQSLTFDKNAWSIFIEKIQAQLK